MELEDIDAMYAVENDTSLWHLGATNVPYSKTFLRDFVCNTTGDIYTDKQARLIVEDLEGHRVGIVDISDFSPKHLRAEIGIVIFEEFQGRGYATQAIREVIGYARTVLHLHQLYAYVESDNHKSLSAFRSCGFQPVATLPQWISVGDAFHDVILLQFFLKIMPD